MPLLSVIRANHSAVQNYTYAYDGGAGAAVVAVPDGAYLTSAAAFATAAGATLQIGAGPAIPVPAGGSLSHEPDGGILGPVNVTFVGTAGYLVEWLAP